MKTEIFNEVFRDKEVKRSQLFNFNKKPCKGGLFDERIFGKVDEKRAYEYSKNIVSGSKLSCIDTRFGYYKLCMPVYMNKGGKILDIKPSKGVILKILPAMFRPYFMGKNGKNRIDSINILYRNIINADLEVKKRIKKNIKVNDLPTFFYYYSYLQKQVDLLFEQLYSMYKSSFSENEEVSEDDKNATNMSILRAMNLISLSDCGRAYKVIECVLESIEECEEITIDNITEKIPDSLLKKMRNVSCNFAYLMNDDLNDTLEELYYGYCGIEKQKDEKIIQEDKDEYKIDELFNENSSLYLTECPFEEFK